MKHKYQKKSSLSPCKIFVFLLICLLTIYVIYCYIQHQKEILHYNEVVSQSLSNKDNFNPTTHVKSIISYPPVKVYNPESHNYPEYKPLLSLIEYWNPDDPDPPTYFNETLQHFNYSNHWERKMAEAYRNAEVPFKIYNVPEFTRATELWTDDYLIKNMAFKSAHVEKSESNHFMFWNMRGKKDTTFVPPTEIVKLSFREWLIEAYQGDSQKITNSSAHYYFMTGTTPGDRLRSSDHFVTRDLSFFSSRENNFFVTDVTANKGIQCRFSMRGIISESHFDSGKNMVAMLKGSKRYILTPPHSCKQLGIISDTKHPSYRHSVFDWSDVNQAKFHDFVHVDAIDTILQQGEVLYIPSFWLHYIISLRYSIQCNSRSGLPKNQEGLDEINKCVGNTGLDKQRKGKKKGKSASSKV